VIKLSGKDKRGEMLWECECSCGNRKTALSLDLRLGRVKSCGCLPRGHKKGTANKSFAIGEKHNDWTIISKAPAKHNTTYVLCRCVCGVEKVVNLHYIRKGLSKSCGGHRTALTHNGKTQNEVEWSKDTGLYNKLISKRKVFCKWDDDKVLTRPSQRKPKITQ
jgi:hypothetical protein